MPGTAFAPAPRRPRRASRRPRGCGDASGTRSPFLPLPARSATSSSTSSPRILISRSFFIPPTFDRVELARGVHARLDVPDERQLLRRTHQPRGAVDDAASLLAELAGRPLQLQDHVDRPGEGVRPSHRFALLTRPLAAAASSGSIARLTATASFSSFTPDHLSRPSTIRTPVRCRRSAARGVPLNVLSELLGHADIGVTTKVYVGFYGRDEAEYAFRKAMSGAS